MNINIRNEIIKNFKGCKKDELKKSIETSIADKDEITLPGIGVLFEILWKNCNENDKEFILKILQRVLV